ncbi:Kelch repeat type 1 [Macleaya cordata]|uniref:Kelch repeat type 1 n=1 Tax=Macleaya cordata TaxID=56857 RepID=A0A200PNA6_MACCD|nr:Kelch repeat type 1 [Macleaya cordata]
MEELIPGLPEEIGRECLIRIPYKQFSTVLAVSKRWKQETESKEFHHRRRNRGFNQNLIALLQSDPIMASDTAKNNSTATTTTTTTTPVYRLSLYEPGKNEWERLPPIPGYSDRGLPLFCQCAGVGRYLVVIAGWNTTTWEVLNSVYVFDLLTATWRRGSGMPGERRTFFACASDSVRTVFVAGGHDEEKNALRSALAYDVVEDEWVQLPDMAKERDECKGLFHGGKFHVIGGYETEMQGRFDKSSEAFDVATWKWGSVEDKLRTATCPRTCLFDHEGTLYKCGPAYMSRLVGSTWQQFAELPADVRNGTYAVRWRKKMLVIGCGLQGGTHSCYELESGKDEQQYTWRKVETPEGFTGYVQSGCNLELYWIGCGIDIWTAGEEFTAAGRRRKGRRSEVGRPPESRSPERRLPVAGVEVAGRRSDEVDR